MDPIPRCTAILTVVLALAAGLGGCAPGPDQLPVKEWVLDAPGAAGDGPVRLPARLGDRLPDERSTYTLSTTVHLPPELQGRALDLQIPYFPGIARLEVEGEEAVSLVRRGQPRYRRSGPHGWRVPAEDTADGEVALSLQVEHTWTQSGWLDVVPRLGPAGIEAPHAVAVRWVNVVAAGVAAIALLYIAITYFAIYLVDRRRRSYLWFTIQAMGASCYPLFVAGYTQHLLGPYDVGVLSSLLAAAPIVSIWFTHDHYGLGPPSRAWLILLGATVAVSSVAHGPFVSTWWAGKAGVACVLFAAVYQIGLLVRLSVIRPRKRGAVLLLGAWLGLLLGGTPDMVLWAGLGDPAQGLRLACPALVLFALLQGLHLGREHIHSLNRSDDLNVELAARVGELQRGQREVQLLNEELRRQIADRSGQLLTALALMGGRSGKAPALRPGDEIERRYRVVREVGRGGMGAVYEVERLATGERLALKVTRELDSIALARLAREAKIAAQVNHPNVVAIHDVDVSQSGFLYLVMELVVGPSLRDRRDRYGDVPWALPILAQVARGLEALHSAGIVHRDLKPANVLLTEEGDERVGVKITDFGISRLAVEGGDPSGGSGAMVSAEVGTEAESEPGTLTGPVTVRVGQSTPITPRTTGDDLTQTGLLSGTPEYLAPELSSGADWLSPAADAFSLGVMAFEVLSGRRPFAEPLVLTVLREGSVPPPPSFASAVGELPPEALAVLDRCLSLDPARRPTAQRIADALSKYPCDPVG